MKLEEPQDLKRKYAQKTVKQGTNKRQLSQINEKILSTNFLL